MTDVVYVLRLTDGYDSNTVCVASTDLDIVLRYIDVFPLTHRVDYYMLDEWVDGRAVNSTSTYFQDFRTGSTSGRSDD